MAIGQAIAPAPNGRILWWPGLKSPGVLTDRSSIYVESPSHTWALMTSPPGPTARNQTCMVFDDNRSLFILSNGSDGTLVTDTWETAGNVADPTTWHDVTGSITGTPFPREGAGAAWAPAFGMMVFGGSNGVGTVYAKTQFYDGTHWTTPSLSLEPSARWLPSAVYNSTTKKFIIFGGQAAGGVNLNDTWIGG